MGSKKIFVVVFFGPRSFLCLESQKFFLGGPHFYLLNFLAVKFFLEGPKKFVFGKIKKMGGGGGGIYI